MKLLKRSIERNGPGFVTLVCDEPEDMWHIFNLVVNESSTGTTSSQRVQITLTVVVENIDFDPGASALHLKGRNTQENDLVKMGAYHTLDIEPGRKFTLEKAEWDSIDLERLDVALDPAVSADVAAVVMHEGLAHVCLLTPAMTLVKAKIDMPHEKGLTRFLDAVATAFLRHVNMQVVLIASRGFLKEQFLEHLIAAADTAGKKFTSEQRSRFVLAHSSSGFKHALKEVLADPQVASRLQDTKAQQEVQALNKFYELMSTEPDRAFYGYAHVRKANEAEAIETLLLSDALFRAQDVAERKKYVKLVESVREQNGTVLIFSALHVSGEQLGQLTGIAAILRFPMPELEDHNDGDEQATAS